MSKEGFVVYITWESNSVPPTQKATHPNQLSGPNVKLGLKKKPCLRKEDHINEIVSG